MFSDSEVQQLQARFPLAQRHVYLNSCSKGALCAEHRSSVQEYLDTWDEYGAPWNLWLGKVEEARNSFAALVRALSEEIAVTFCVSTGANAIASSFEFTGGRRKVLLSAHEFPTLAHIWLAQQARGAEVQFVTPQPGEDLVDAFGRAVDGETAVVVAHQIHHGDGAFVDVARLARLCHARGARLFLDAYHSAGVVDLDVRQLDVDFLVTGSMKYLLGATGGVAFLYVRKELIPELKPLYTGWFSQRNIFTYGESELDYADSARRFESGLQPIAAVYPTVAGLAVIQEVGAPRIQAHVSELAALFADQLRSKGIRPSTPQRDGDRPQPMVSVPCLDPALAIRVLADRNIIVAGWQNLLRFSFHLYTSPADIERTSAAIYDSRELFCA